MAPSRLQLVEGAEDAQTTPPEQDNTVAVKMMLMAMKALSQRALIALASLFNLAAGASVFVLALSMPNPTVYQLVLLGMYSIFVLAACYLTRKF